MKKYFKFLLAAFFIFLGCKNNIDYSKNESWAFLEAERLETSADVFFICPTVYGGSENSFNMPLSDEKAKEAFVGATNMEKGIYDDNARFFAPFYRQIGLNAYTKNSLEREKYLKLAYDDVKDAFKFYIKNYNDGRPIILAGFSQGADLCLRLVKDFFVDEKYASKLVACYAIGWSIFEDDEDAKKLKFAAGAKDTGTIISFNTEAEFIEESMMIPKNKKAVSINPLNWKTDSTAADKSLNIGACFTDYSGEIKQEIPALTGCYLDSKRGALKVLDVSSKEYPAFLPIFEDGIFHLYDYQFFYRNLEKNVQERIEEFISASQTH